ncbi:MAG: M20/M25/M40 family metallo-hydrolase [Acidobacteria bacterium]|nr:MAG: M20/M25/M40 family metallo-hydrolase [Acidobacteriota bacterium]
MRRIWGSACLVGLSMAVLALGPARDEALDLSVLSRIRDEGFNRSKVMDTASYLCDVIGPRLTGSPAYKKAHEWTRDQLSAWGLEARMEPWDFGRGWTVEHVSVHMTQPAPAPLLAVPLGWSAGTKGAVRGKAMKVKLESEQDLANYRGKVTGMILLNGEAPTLKVHERAEYDRYSEEELVELSQYRIDPSRGGAPGSPGVNYRNEYARRRQFTEALNKFLAEEKPLALVAAGENDGGNVRLIRGSQRAGESSPVPHLVMAAEHYTRIARLLDRNMEVELELDLRVRFTDQEEKGYNTVADIAGTDLKDEIVLLGGHLDSWHPGTGATDDASGVSVVMEAVRILNALEIKPRRTIRVGLWGGEEQGFLGSRAYVTQHLATRAEPTDPEERKQPEFMRRERGELQLKPEYSKFSVYFNLDNGTGKIRGVYLQGNAAVQPIFEAWLKPVADLGATTTTLRNTGGTDHIPFDSVGLPGFQFIQDSVEYMSRTHHTNMDVFDRLQREDLMQASVVMAWFAYNAAMRDELVPRKPLPPQNPERRPPTD